MTTGKRKNVIANRYEVVQHIGQGGMADVFRAVDTILNREVAIKILRADLSTDAVSILRFEREAQAATALASHVLPSRARDGRRDGCGACHRPLGVSGSSS